MEPISDDRWQYPESTTKTGKSTERWVYSSFGTKKSRAPSGAIRRRTTGLSLSLLVGISDMPVEKCGTSPAFGQNLRLALRTFAGDPKGLAGHCGAPLGLLDGRPEQKRVRPWDWAKPGQGGRPLRCQPFGLSRESGLGIPLHLFEKSNWGRIPIAMNASEMPSSPAARLGSGQSGLIS